MKRDRENGEIEAIYMAKCLMLLSKVGQNDEPTQGRAFECKTCNKRFSSFQALGGHRASHKKPRLMGGDLFVMPASPKKPKTHECSICGLEFPIGQALGGHMRRHRAVASNERLITREFLPVPVLKKSNSSKRVFSLNLNSTTTENDLKLTLGTVAA